MTDIEILRDVGLGTLLNDVSNNLIGRWVLKAMVQARADEREACATICDGLHFTWAFGDESGPRDCANEIRKRNVPMEPGKRK